MFLISEEQRPIGYEEAIVGQQEQKLEDKDDEWERRGRYSPKVSFKNKKRPRVKKEEQPTNLRALSPNLSLRCALQSCHLRHGTIIQRTLHLRRGEKLFYNLIETHLTKWIAVAMRELCTPTVNLAKYVNERIKHLG